MRKSKVLPRFVANDVIELSVRGVVRIQTSPTASGPPSPTGEGRGSD
ncbi:MAG: hypothetical protein JNK50_00160 [Bacteroidia bacterium]|nr:hypothetical protein [Bacteroidia bacterium]